MDEACFGHVKKTMPHQPKSGKQYMVKHGEWWAAVPRGDNYIVMQELPNKPRRGPPKKKDVMPLVEKWIKSGSLIMTDGLKCYRTLNTGAKYKKRQYTQRYVRHGRKPNPEFVRPVQVDNITLIAGTQKVDGLWGNIKQWMGGMRGVPHEYLPDQIREYQWKTWIAGEEKEKAFAGVVRCLQEENLIRI